MYPSLADFFFLLGLKSWQVPAPPPWARPVLLSLLTGQQLILFSLVFSTVFKFRFSMCSFRRNLKNYMFRIQMRPS